jgi:hypothetical protein
VNTFASNNEPNKSTDVLKAIQANDTNIPAIIFITDQYLTSTDTNTSPKIISTATTSSGALLNSFAFNSKTSPAAEKYTV